MRKGLIFYVLSAVCTLSSIITLSSCSSANVDNYSGEILPSCSSINPNESKEEEFMADYTDLETFRNDVINGVDVVGKTLRFLNDNGEYCDGFIWRIYYKDITFVSQGLPGPDYCELGKIINIKIDEVREPSPSHDKYIVYYSFIPKY